MNAKVLPAAVLERHLQKVRRRKKKIVFTNGCFDLLHLGHVRLLQKAKSCGDILVVGLNTDGSVRRLKGKARPILPQKDRAGILAALESVDYVTFFPEDTPAKLIRRLSPDVLVKGGDYGENSIVGAEWVKKHGGRVVVFPLVEGRGTSRLIARIAAGAGRKNRERCT